MHCKQSYCEHLFIWNKNDVRWRIESLVYTVDISALASACSGSVKQAISFQKCSIPPPTHPPDGGTCTVLICMRFECVRRSLWIINTHYADRIDSIAAHGPLTRPVSKPSSTHTDWLCHRLTLADRSINRTSPPSYTASSDVRLPMSTAKLQTHARSYYRTV